VEIVAQLRGVAVANFDKEYTIYYAAIPLNCNTKAPAKSILAIAQIEKLADNNYSLILVPANQHARN
jgi:hypothetical protein